MVVDKLEKEGSFYAPVVANGTFLTFGTDTNFLTIDAADSYGDAESVVNVYTQGEGKDLTTDAGNGKDGIYTVATVTIPAVKTETVEAGTKVNEQTGKEETAYEVKQLPLDMEAVRVTLWPIPFEVKAEETKQEEN